MPRIASSPPWPMRICTSRRCGRRPIPSGWTGGQHCRRTACTSSLYVNRTLVASMPENFRQADAGRSAKAHAVTDFHRFPTPHTWPGWPCMAMRAAEALLEHADDGFMPSVNGVRRAIHWPTRGSPDWFRSSMRSTPAPAASGAARVVHSLARRQGLATTPQLARGRFSLAPLKTLLATRAAGFATAHWKAS